MDVESDDRGSLRERVQALEAEVTGARATLAELQRKCAGKEQRVAQLEEHLARLEGQARERRSPKAKLMLGAFLLPVAAMGGALSGVTASLPIELAALAFGVKGDWPLTTMVPFLLVGTLSALTLAVRWLQRS